MAAETRTPRKASMSPWSDTPDADHPIFWEPADDKEAARWTTIAEARMRLERHGWDGQNAIAALLNGHTLRTPFAFYSMPKPNPIR